MNAATYTTGCPFGERVHKHGLDNGVGDGVSSNGILEEDEVLYSTAYCSVLDLKVVTGEISLASASDLEIIEYQGNYYFTARDGNGNWQIMVSNLLDDLSYTPLTNFHSSAAKPYELTVAHGQLYFNYDAGGSIGLEPWSLDLTSNEVRPYNFIGTTEYVYSGLDAGSYNTCYITVRYTIDCEGEFTYPNNRDNRFIDIAVGDDIVCGINFYDEIYCSEGSLYFIGGTAFSKIDLPSERFAISIDGFNDHMCAILDDGSAMCWGYNHYGQLGDGTNANSNTPVAVSLPAGRTATALALGSYHSCAILDDASTMSGS